MAHGAPGRALTLAGAGAIAIDQAARELLLRLDAGDTAALQALADSFRGAEGAERFQLLFARLAERTHDSAVEQVRRGEPPSDRLGAVWERLVSLPAEAEALNLDRADVFWTALGELRAAAAT
jgi:DNA polymerase-3 subunit delta'